MSEPHVEVTATVTDRHGGRSTVYAGSLPVWAWEDREARRPWLAVRRTLILGDLTADPRGWRVRFTAEYPEVPCQED